VTAPIRVFLIDDSTVVRGALRRIIDATSDLRVVGAAANGRLGLEGIAQAAPDVVLLDIEMPEMDGLTTLPRLIAAHPGVRVIMASSLTQRGALVTLEALAMGAADYITKPTARAGPDALAPMAEQVVAKIRALGRAPGATAGAASRVARPEPRRTPRHGDVAPIVEPPSAGFRRGLGGWGAPPEIVAIAASTGGPNALATVLRGLPPEFRTPLVVTQHMPPLFTLLLAQRLERESGRRCHEATDGMPLEEGHVYIAPGDHHLLVAPAKGGWQMRLTQTPPENHCRPSADPMLRSVSEGFGARALAVVLTGMGEDGRRGCEAIRATGGRVLVQDEATSVVWGMPGAVVSAGCADWVVGLPQVAHRIAQLELVLR
jgi:two-component system chemotaxis response regulator CheB